MNDRAVRLRRAPSTEPERLSAIIHFAHKLTTAVYRREQSGARASVNLLLNSLGPMLNLTHDDVKSIVERALGETSEVFQAMKMPLDHLRLKRQTEAALEQIDEEPVAETGVEIETRPETLATLLRDVTAQVDRGSESDLRPITLMVMEAIYRGGPFDHVLFALLDETGHRLVGKIGFGESIDKIIKSFNFLVTASSGPLATAVLRRTDVVVAGPRDRRFEGSRFSQVVNEPVYGLLPLVAGGAVVGCLYFDRHDPRNIDPAMPAAVGALRDQLCRVLTRSRAGIVLSPGGSGR